MLDVQFVTSNTLSIHILPSELLNYWLIDGEYREQISWLAGNIHIYLDLENRNILLVVIYRKCLLKLDFKTDSAIIIIIGQFSSLIIKINHNIKKYPVSAVFRPTGAIWNPKLCKKSSIICWCRTRSLCHYNKDTATFSCNPPVIAARNNLLRRIKARDWQKDKIWNFSFLCIGIWKWGSGISSN